MGRITEIVWATGALAMGGIAFAQSQNPSLRELLDQFQTTNSARQLEIGKQIVKVGSRVRSEPIDTMPFTC
jgi:hypothetical protein